MSFQIDWHLHRRQDATKQLALFHAIRERIVTGSSSTGEALPSTRDLARQYGLSRGTVTQVYEMLAADGYIRSESRQRTLVSYRSPTAEPVKGVDVVLSEWARRCRPHQPAERAEAKVHFYPGFTDQRIFPNREWQRSISRSLRQPSQRVLHPAGHPELRERLAAHLRYHRNIQARAENTVIVNGSTQAIALLALMLLEKGDRAIMEDPGFGGTHSAILAAGGLAIRAPVDEQGIDISTLSSIKPRARLAFVTPTHQFPTGVVLSFERRLQLLEWAERQGAIIIEDDYDSEFRRSGKPLEPLRSLSPGRVVYMGTFSRTMSLSLRLGYVVLPDSLIKPFLRAKAVFETYSTAWMEQAALADFMGSGAYERHLRRMTRIYRQRHDTLLQLFEEHLPGAFVWTASDAGLHLFGRWQYGRQRFNRFEKQCAAAGIGFTSADRFYESKSPPSALFAFAHLNPEEAAPAIERMGRILKRLQ